MPYDTWKQATPPEYENEPESEDEPDTCALCGALPHGPSADCTGDRDRNQPPPGSWAETARLMAQFEPDFDWDAWKDEMKERDF